MRPKTILGAVLAVSLSLVAVPAVASASPTVDIEGSTHFTASGGTAQLHVPNRIVHCEAISGEGEFASDEGSTGTVQLAFHGCTTTVLGFRVACTTEGQVSKTITTTELEFHVMAHNLEPVMLITTTEGHFATFVCASPQFEVGGNGIVGAIISPIYNFSSLAFTVEFAETEAEGGGQAITTTDETIGTDWKLTASVEGGEPEPSWEVASATGVFTEGEATITE
ncbi:MAG TPA: hypothetical protein VFG58_07515 [Solirubrobacterales bacterium]|nr:hypothetical protein [Solirubrobacterales bacterium]